MTQYIGANVDNTHIYKDVKFVENTVDIEDHGIATYNEGTIAHEAQASAVWAKVIEGLTAEQIMKITLAALAGKRAGIGTATETYYAPDGTTPRISLTPTDANGNGTPVVTP